MVLGPFGQARINDGAGVAASAYETLLSLLPMPAHRSALKLTNFFIIFEGTGLVRILERSTYLTGLLFVAAKAP
jgi:hypothetical protein